jgi:hypothetical protein
MNTPKPIQIFRTGRHVAMSGAALSFSESDLQACANAYDPAKHEAPIVVGHPKHDGPAYGWVNKLSFAEGGLEADPHQVNPDFAELVEQGAFKKISASFYAPDSPQNPVPGVYYLRHVGFLGAQPPAVKGLRSPEFADAEEGVVEFGDWDDRTNAGLWRGLRDWLLAKFGQEDADRAIPSWNVSSLEASAAQPENDDGPQNAPIYSEAPNQETSVTPEQAAKLEAENAQLKQRVAEAEARDKSAQAAARHADHAAFAEKLVGAGKLLPTHKAFVVAFMDHVASEAGVIEFGEGEAKQSQPGIDAFKSFLESQPKVVDFTERAGGEPGHADGDLTDPSEINRQALAFMETERQAGRTVEHAAAVEHVMKQA